MLLGISSGSHFWLGLICLAVGTLAVAPLLLSKSFRKRFAPSGTGLEGVGLVLLVVAVIIVSLYRNLGHLP